MFENTVTLENQNKSFSLVDIDNGRSIRRASDGGELTLSHVKTKENGPLGTSRHLVRVDKTYPSLDSSRMLKASAYLVLTVPTQIGVGNLAGTTAASSVAQELLEFLVFGDASSDITYADMTEYGTHVLPGFAAQLTRFLAGEP